MDLLFKRYASPFLLLDNMISSCRMCEFVDEVLKLKHEEDEEKTMWEFFLHKVFDMSYADFLAESKGSTAPDPDENMDFETTLNDSFDMLSEFVPE